jgi:paraquat-inducible protein B
MEEAAQKLVDKGLRVEIATSNYVTGQQIISLVMVPGASPASVTQEGDAFVLPSQGAGFDKITASLTTISASLAKVPFEAIGNNLNKLLVTTNNTIGGPQLKQSLASLNETLKAANTLLGGINQGYGSGSDFQQNMDLLMNQANNTLYSINQLTNYLDRHPESLLLGRSKQ